MAMDETLIRFQPLGRACNRNRPQTFRLCAQCGVQFGPIRHLLIRHCSSECANKSKRLPPEERKPRAIRKRLAACAQRRIAYLIQMGRMVRPEKCEQCGIIGKIEAAHFDYHEPEKVRWLCVGCHRRWDRAEPKGGTEPR